MSARTFRIFLTQIPTRLAFYHLYKKREECSYVTRFLVWCSRSLLISEESGYAAYLI